MNLDRLCLYAPPEDKAEIGALGARWDGIYCESGTVLDEPPSQFAVSNIRAVDAVLARNGSTLQEDLYLHSEPARSRS
jgi:hypothetical protein